MRKEGQEEVVKRMVLRLKTLVHNLIGISYVERLVKVIIMFVEVFVMDKNV